MNKKGRVVAKKHRRSRARIKTKQRERRHAARRA